MIRSSGLPSATWKVQGKPGIGETMSKKDKGIGEGGKQERKKKDVRFQTWDQRLRCLLNS